MCQARTQRVCPKHLQRSPCQGRGKAQTLFAEQHPPAGQRLLSIVCVVCRPVCPRTTCATVWRYRHARSFRTKHRRGRSSCGSRIWPPPRIWSSRGSGPCLSWSLLRCMQVLVGGRSKESATTDKDTRAMECPKPKSYKGYTHVWWNTLVLNPRPLQPTTHACDGATPKP